MGKRGPKPVHIGLLNMWEFEWYKALHLLREGTLLPGREGPQLEPALADKRIQSIRKLPLWKILGQEPPPEDWVPTKPGDRASRSAWELWGESVRHDQIAAVMAMKPKEIHAKAARREIWRSLWSAKSSRVLKRVCDEWRALPDVQGHGLSCFADHVMANAKEFLAMTANARFPKAPASDDSRLVTISRGMAGVMAGVSPMTGIERLRNMKHRSGGSLWNKEFKCCRCWRCEQKRWDEQDARELAALQVAENEEDE